MRVDELRFNDILNHSIIKCKNAMKLKLLVMDTKRFDFFRGIIDEDGDIYMIFHNKIQKGRRLICIIEDIRNVRCQGMLSGVFNIDEFEEKIKSL